MDFFSSWRAAMTTFSIMTLIIPGFTFNLLNHAMERTVLIYNQVETKPLYAQSHTLQNVSIIIVLMPSVPYFKIIGISGIPKSTASLG